MIEQIDFLVRVVAIGAALMLMAQIVAGEVRETIKFPMVAMIIGAIAYLIQSSGMLMTEGPLEPWVDLVAIATPFWIWLLGRRLLGREPERRIALIALAVLLIGWVLAYFIPLAQQGGFYLTHLAALALVGDLVRLAVQGRDLDLDTEKSVVRLWLPRSFGVLAGIILLAEIIGEAIGLPALVELACAVLVLLVTVFAGLALMRSAPELLIESKEEAGEEVASEPVPDDAAAAESA